MMTTYEATGKVESVGATETFGANGFTKREIVLDLADENLKYPSPVPFTLKKDKCALADNLQPGDKVSVMFTIDGRRWDGPKGTRYFVDLTAWKIAIVSGGVTAAEQFKTLWLKTHGGELDKPAVAKFVTDATGKSVKDMDDFDWVKAAKTLENKANDADAGETDEDDLPF